MALLTGVRLSVLAALMATACQSVAEKGKAAVAPVSVADEYLCGDGVHIAVQLLDGEEAAVSVDGATAVNLPRLPSRSGPTYYSNGRQMLIVELEEVSWVQGRDAPQRCSPA